MEHDSLFKHFNRRKYIYDPNARPNYALQRIQSAGVDFHYTDIVIKEEILDGIAGEWIFNTSKSIDDSHGTILFFHGGAFVRGSKSSERSFCRELVLNSNYNIYSTDYALAPEHPFPEGLEDCMKVYEALCKTVPKGASNIVLCGESAGATMALTVAVYAKMKGISLPKGIVLLSPSVQCERPLPSHTENLETDCMLTNFMDEIKAEYFQTCDPSVLAQPLASPINADFTGFPPVYITASDSEVLRDDAVLLSEKLQKQGVECTLDMAHGLMHVYPIMTALKESKEAVKRICSFLV